YNSYGKHRIDTEWKMLDKRVRRKTMIYENIDGHINRRVVFITTHNEGEIFSSTVSKSAITADKKGHIFIVDDYVAEQIDKFKIVEGTLKLKDGETLDEPVKSDI